MFSQNPKRSFVMLNDYIRSYRILILSNAYKFRVHLCSSVANLVSIDAA